MMISYTHSLLLLQGTTTFNNIQEINFNYYFKQKENKAKTFQIFRKKSKLKLKLISSHNKGREYSIKNKGGSSKGASGGIATIWNLNSVKGYVLIQENNFSCIRFEHLNDGTSWVLTNIYAPNTLKARNYFWKKLIETRDNFKNLSQLVMRDFNNPLREEEKFGGSPSQLESRLALMDFINTQALNDVEIQRCNYTWTNRRTSNDLIQVHLDRTLIFDEWYRHYFCSLSTHIQVRLDHFPITFIVDPINRRRNFPFRFEKMWTHHPDINRNIQKWWSIQVEGTAMYRVCKET